MSAEAENSRDVVQNLLQQQGESGVMDSLLDSNSELVRAFRGGQKTLPAHGELVVPDRPGRAVFFLFTGWAHRYRLLPDGRRQIIDIYLPGDLVGIDAFLGTRPTDGIVALTDISYGALEIPVFEKLVVDSAVALQLISLMGAERRRIDSRLVDVGRLLAEEKIAALILELYERLCQRGLVKRPSFILPLTQQQIGDHLGMTIVHVNRVLRRLRENGVLVLQRQTVIIQDMAKLRTLVSCSIKEQPLSVMSNLPPSIRANSETMPR